jgi:hypothetical protein
LVGEGRQAESGSLAKLLKTLRDCEARPVGCAFFMCAFRKQNQNTKTKTPKPKHQN